MLADRPSATNNAAAHRNAVRPRSRPGGPSRLAAAAALLLGATLLMWLGAGRVLRAAGWMLVSEDPLRHAEAVVVPQWAENAGAIEAADLVHQGFAPRVAVMVMPPDPADQELIRRGVVSPRSENWYTRLVRILGVANVEQIVNPATGTEAEGGILPEWCAQNGIHSVIVVSTPDHSRRLRRVLRRTVRDRDITVTIHVARYAEFDPSRWWKSRDGVRTEIVEVEKLALDVLRHPFG